MNKLLILGAGGHGRVVAEAAESMNCWKEILFLDDAFPENNTCLDFPVVGKITDIDSHLGESIAVAVAIGHNKLRLKLLNDLIQKDVSLPVIAHQSAVISKSAMIAVGTVIMAGCVINAECQIGLGGIINTGSTVDHNCVLGDAVHLSPGVHLGGNVTVGNRVWLGVGSAVIHEISIGHDVIVGAGAAVINDIDSNVTVAGVPAKVIKQ